MSISVASFAVGKEANFPLHLPCILSLFLTLCLACYARTNRLAVIVNDLLTPTGSCNWTLHVAFFITRTHVLQTARL